MVRIETPVAISGRDRIVRDRSGRILFSLDCIEAPSSLQQLVIARRIVAAINATENIHTTALERIVKRGHTLQLALAYSTMNDVEGAVA